MALFEHAVVDGRECTVIRHVFSFSDAGDTVGGGLRVLADRDERD
ncbi:hypothetical protein [Pseudoruegeria sp. HB172150]|nr:hypothetical protein [Pseudoruegeria sp. HB172150]